MTVSVAGTYPVTRLSVQFAGSDELDWKIWEDTDPATIDPAGFGSMILAQALREHRREPESEPPL